jgi:hypothetical protein
MFLHTYGHLSVMLKLKKFQALEKQSAKQITLDLMLKIFRSLI